MPREGQRWRDSWHWDHGNQTFIEKPLTFTTTGLENAPVNHSKFVNIFTTELMHAVMLVKGPRKK